MAHLMMASSATALWDGEPIEGAFTLADAGAPPESAVVTAVERPWLLRYAPPADAPNTRRAMLVLGGGGYTQLMAGREGVAVAH